MFTELCARIFLKSPNFQVARWFPVTAEVLEDVPFDMDLIEGPVRYRKRKKWKSRWAVLRRVNPAADVLNLILYQDQVSARTRQKEKAFISLQSFSGLQLLNKLDKHFNVIIIITTSEIIPLCFDTIEQRTEWVTHFQRHFGKEQSFEGIIPRHKQKIKSGEATLRFYKTFFTITRKDNYKCLRKWDLVDLPHYGAVDGGFAFQVKDDITAGLPSIYYFATRQGRELHRLFDSVCRGVEVPPENSYVDPADNHPEGQQDGGLQPNFFKRAWQRISGRKRRQPRPRSRSEPEPRRNRKRRGNAGAQFVKRELPSVPDRAENPRSLSDSEKDKKPSQSSVQHPLTPDGYEIMSGNSDEGDDDIFTKSRPSRSSESSGGIRSVGKSCSGEYASQPIGEEGTDHDGYVLVDEMDVEEIVKEAERRIAEEKRKEEEEEKRKREEEEEKAKILSVEKEEKQNKENGIGDENDTGKSKEAASIEEPQSQSVECKEEERAVVKTQNCKTKEEEKKEKLVNGDVGKALDNEKQIDDDVKEKAVTKKVKVPPPTMPKKIPQSLNLQEQRPAKESPRVRRGARNPPPEILLPDGSPVSPDSPDSPYSPYMNSPPRTADYVNVPGSRYKILNARDRRKTTGTKLPIAKKLNLYDIYDGNDDSIYHSVESLMPGNPAYQNIQYESNRSHSFENLPGHSYSNMPGRPGGVQAYQNIGPSGETQAYVNINAPRRKFQRNPNSHNLNYIQVEGTDGRHGPPMFSTPSEQSNAAAKPSSDYTWIDESKTHLLKETARVHSNLRKENLPKLQGKKF